MEATLERLSALWEWHKRDKDQAKMEFKDPEELLKTTDTRKAIEELEHFLVNKLESVEPLWPISFGTMLNPMRMRTKALVSQPLPRS